MSEQIPICIVCGHQACEGCRTWCDYMVGEENDEPCCGGECTYPDRKPAE